MIERTIHFPRHVWRDGVLAAYVSEGRWVVDCPCCNSALKVGDFGRPLEFAAFGCIECGHGLTEAAWAALAKLPPEARARSLGQVKRDMQAAHVRPAEAHEIERALEERGHWAWRNWRPGMTAEELREATPGLHFSWTAPRTWVVNEVVTAAIGNTHWRDNLLETAPAKLTAAGDLPYASAANALARLAKGTAYQGLRMNAGATAPEWAESFPYILIRDEKAQNTMGGTATSGAWRTRDLNTEVVDTGGHASVASNQITLEAGTYRICASAPAVYCGSHQARLQNITDVTTALVGTPSKVSTSDGDSDDSRSFIVGRITIAAQKTFEIQHQVQTTRATDGFGRGANFTTEIYTVFEAWKEA